MWTKASPPPVSGWMKPYPLSALKNLTVPVIMILFLLVAGRHSAPRCCERREKEEGAAKRQRPSCATCSGAYVDAPGQDAMLAPIRGVGPALVLPVERSSMGGGPL